MGTGFWGESILGSLKSRDLSAQFLKSSTSESSRVTKLKPVVACSVLTSDINKEAMVSEFHAISLKSNYEQIHFLIGSIIRLTVALK